VIFADVRLQPGDDAARLLAAGLPLKEDRGRRAEGKGQKLPQPCAAFDGCRCRVYVDRPGYCRQFECVLLKSVKEGRTPAAQALRVIRSARQRADKVKQLLRELGDADEQTALAARFRRTARRIEKIGFDEKTADLYGRLTLAVHDLNFLLSEAFYPGTRLRPGAGGGNIML
jgi:Fe-S-cluster containining protein